MKEGKSTGGLRREKYCFREAEEVSCCRDWRTDLRSFSEITESLSLSSMEKRSFNSWTCEVG